MRKTLIPALIASTLLLTGCGSAAETEAAKEPTTRERLEDQGIVYSDDDYDTTVRRLCASDHPEVYMGVSDALRKNQASMSESEKLNAVLGSRTGGEAPNADTMNDREKQMVIDLVLDNECDE